jgi:two-component system, sensor histidine kinase and response regulator
METLNVLITDDEPEMRRAVDRALRNFTVRVPDVNGEVGFVVTEAPSGEDALQYIASSPPDILLLDHKLPGMTGLDVLQHLVGQQIDLLTVMITAYASIETAISATKRGAFDFIAKPFTPAELKDTVRKAAAHLLLQRQARRLAEEKRQVRFQFISVLAHELKAPLGAIEGYLHTLRDRRILNDPQACDRMIERCLVRSEGMRKMIGDLLDLTRIESGQRKRDLVEIDVREVARSAVDTVTAEARTRSITIGFICPDPMLMIADRTEIEIILNNLLSNAVKYNRDGGRVDLKLSGDDTQVSIVVADTGIGMTEQESQRLFNDFVRIKNQNTKDILGSGLGLSVVKKLAFLYGGDATVSSTPDVGSTFTVLLRRKP